MRACMTGAAFGWICVAVAYDLPISTGAWSRALISLQHPANLLQLATLRQRRLVSNGVHMAMRAASMKAYVPSIIFQRIR